jgi:hypothetical protein
MRVSTRTAFIGSPRLENESCSDLGSKPDRLADVGSQAERGGRRRSGRERLGVVAQTASGMHWGILEVRDTLKAALAPALPLSRLLRRGRSIALALRVQHPHRPMQMTQLRRILRYR